MTARAEYTTEEWTLLITAPQAAIMAVIFSDGVGVLEPLAEAVAALAEQVRGPQRFERNELIGALVSNKESVEPARLPQPQGFDETPDQVFKRLRHMAIQQCRAAMQLLAERSNATEAEGYANWVMASARAAAAARRHKRGLFGPSDEPVDAQEEAMLDEIAEALGATMSDASQGGTRDTDGAPTAEKAPAPMASESGDGGIE